MRTTASRMCHTGRKPANVVDCANTCCLTGTPFGHCVCVCMFTELTRLNLPLCLCLMSFLLRDTAPHRENTCAWVYNFAFSIWVYRCFFFFILFFLNSLIRTSWVRAVTRWVQGHARAWHASVQNLARPTNCSNYSSSSGLIASHNFMQMQVEVLCDVLKKTFKWNRK